LKLERFTWEPRAGDLILSPTAAGVRITNPEHSSVHYYLWMSPEAIPQLKQLIAHLEHVKR
jgi:hypothetical protein